MCEILAIDKTLIRDFEPELKAQSNKWRDSASPQQIKFQQAQSKAKQMIIFVYDHREIIITDRVPCGTSVTAVYYHVFK